MTSSGIPLTHRLGEKRPKLNLQIFDEKIFQSCNIVLLPVKSLRESVQLLPSQFEYSGPMDLTQVIIRSVKKGDQLIVFNIHDQDDTLTSLLVSVHNQENWNGGEVG